MNKYLQTMIATIGLASLLVLVGCGGADEPMPTDMADNTSLGVALDVNTPGVDGLLAVSDAHDFAHLRTPYVGAAHAVQEILNVLPLPGDNWIVRSFEIGANYGDFAESYSPYTLTVFYELQQGSVIAGSWDTPEIPTDTLVSNSDMLFDLIENLEAVTFSVKFNTPEDDDSCGFFDYYWSRSRDGEYSLQMADAWADASGIVWIVPPVLKYDSIMLCNVGTFVDSRRRIISTDTGELTGYYCDGHGGPPPDFVFDRERGLFGQTVYKCPYHGGVGMIPFDDFEEIIEAEFAEMMASFAETMSDSAEVVEHFERLMAEGPWYLKHSSGLIAVEAVDSSYYIAHQYEYWDEWRLADDAFLGKFAIMHNREFVTDFIFDDAALWWHNYRFATDLTTGQTEVLDMEYIAVSKNGMWGLVDWYGNVAVDFIFENLVMVCSATAFAKYNGYYGILDITGTILAMSTATVPASQSALIAVAGVITVLDPIVELAGETDMGSGFYIVVDYVDRYCQLVDDVYVTSGTPSQVRLKVEDNITLVLTHDTLEEGMIVTVFYEASNLLQADMVIPAVALVTMDYGNVHVDRFDENFLSFDGMFSLSISNDAEIIFQSGEPFDGEPHELANRILAVYVKMSATPPPGGPLVHGLATSKVIVLS